MKTTKYGRNRLQKYGISEEENRRQNLLGFHFCSGKCERFLPLDKFNSSNLKRNCSMCLDCRSSYMREYHEKNKDEQNRKVREYYAKDPQRWRDYQKAHRASLDPVEYELRKFRYRLKTRFGITPEQYDAILESQDGSCAVCGAEKGNRRLPVDHDHKCCPGRKSCGKCIRGILCERCNALVGFLEKFADLIPLCEQYLNRYKMP